MVCLANKVITLISNVRTFKTMISMAVRVNAMVSNVTGANVRLV